MRLSWFDLVEFISFLGYPTEIDAGCFQLLALQGCRAEVVIPASGDAPPYVVLEVIKNVPDRYNDLLICVGRHEDGTLFIDPLVGTVDPGLYYTRTDPNPLGAANLTYGQHRYKPGPHHGRPAFRSVNELNRVWRDADGDFRLDPEEQIYVGQFGTNIHPGGKTDIIGKWSAGCLNVAGGWEGAAWLRLQAYASVHFQHKGELLVTLWRANDLRAWAQSDRVHFRPTVYPGVFGPWAREVQKALQRHGARIQVDGDWRGGTTKLLVAFQKAHGLVQDGIAGPTTWSYLLPASLA